jgi:hypothetical protein
VTSSASGATRGGWAESRAAAFVRHATAIAQVELTKIVRDPHNPLTYFVNARRALMITGGESSAGVAVDFLVLGAVFVAFVVIASRLYESIVR